MIDVQTHKNGSVVTVRAQPGAKKAGVTGTHGGALKVAVTAAPEKGKANIALIETLGKALGVKKSQIQLLSGAAGREKRFLISGMNAKAIEDRLGKILTS